MEKEEKELEIEKLLDFKDKNISSTADKNKAREIKSNIGTFITIDRFDLKYSKSYFDANKSARIDLDDAIEHFEDYIESKLKKKDDWHFHEGIDKLSLGISEVITMLSKAQ